jgi:hypothetical protein
MVGVIDKVFTSPGRKICGSTIVQKNDMRVNAFWGRWEGEWTCENGHVNVLGYKT